MVCDVIALPCKDAQCNYQAMQLLSSAITAVQLPGTVEYRAPFTSFMNAN